MLIDVGYKFPLIGLFPRQVLDCSICFRDMFRCIRWCRE